MKVIYTKKARWAFNDNYLELDSNSNAYKKLALVEYHFQLNKFAHSSKDCQMILLILMIHGKF